MSLVLVENRLRSLEVGDGLLDRFDAVVQLGLSHLRESQMLLLVLPGLDRLFSFLLRLGRLLILLWSVMC